jgi:uncharacterized protein (TIGR02594 family)
MMDTFAVQTRLKSLGFDPGPIDGILGRQTTAAVAAFQAARGLEIKWPGTIGPKTLTALWEGVAAPAPPPGRPPWLDLALRKRGLHEREDHAELTQFLKSDGGSIGDPAKIPWCGDFVETCIAVTLPKEPMIGNPYLARNWGKFGQECEPTLGAVMVFWRGKKNGISGHVAFAVGQSAASYYVLGGNQSDSVSVAPLAKGRLLCARWPLTYPMPERISLAKMSGGKISIQEA